MATTPTAPPAGSAFDRSLELHELRQAAEEFAARHGEPGSAAYRAAWVKFRQHIHSIDDLQRLRARIGRPKGVARTARAVRESDTFAGVAARGRQLVR